MRVTFLPLLTASALALSLCQVASAETVRVAFSGTVTKIDGEHTHRDPPRDIVSNPGKALRHGVSIGDHFSGYFTFDGTDPYAVVSGSSLFQVRRPFGLHLELGSLTIDACDPGVVAQQALTPGYFAQVDDHSVDLGWANRRLRAARGSGMKVDGGSLHLARSSATPSQGAPLTSDIFDWEHFSEGDVILAFHGRYHGKQSYIGVSGTIEELQETTEP